MNHLEPLGLTRLWPLNADQKIEFVKHNLPRFPFNCFCKSDSETASCFQENLYTLKEGLQEWQYKVPNEQKLVYVKEDFWETRLTELTTLMKDIEEKRKTMNYKEIEDVLSPTMNLMLWSLLGASKHPRDHRSEKTFHVLKTYRSMIQKHKQTIIYDENQASKKEITNAVDWLIHKLTMYQLQFLIFDRIPADGKRYTLDDFRTHFRDKKSCGRTEGDGEPYCLILNKALSSFNQYNWDDDCKDKPKLSIKTVLALPQQKKQVPAPPPPLAGVQGGRVQQGRVQGNPVQQGRVQAIPVQPGSVQGSPVQLVSRGHEAHSWFNPIASVLVFCVAATLPSAVVKIAKCA